MTQFLQYGAELKRHRTLMQTYIGSRTAIDKVEDLQETEVRQLLLRLLQNPAAFHDHIRL